MQNNATADVSWDTTGSNELNLGKPLGLNYQLHSKRDESKSVMLLLIQIKPITPPNVPSLCAAVSFLAFFFLMFFFVFSFVMALDLWHAARFFPPLQGSAVSKIQSSSMWNESRRRETHGATCDFVAKAGWWILMASHSHWLSSF